MKYKYKFLMPGSSKIRKGDQFFHISEWIVFPSYLFGQTVNRIFHANEVRRPIKSTSRTSTNSDYAAALEKIIMWLDGQHGSFPIIKSGEGPYYWRNEMMKRLNAAKRRHCA